MPEPARLGGDTRTGGSVDHESDCAADRSSSFFIFAVLARAAKAWCPQEAQQLLGILLVLRNEQPRVGAVHARRTMIIASQ